TAHFSGGMRHGLGLRQNISQTLVMTPQLVQAIKLLQMSHLELTAHVEDELEKNPILEQPLDGTPDAPNGVDQVEQAVPAEMPEQAEPDSDSWSPETLTGDAPDLSGPPDSDFTNLYQDDNEAALTPSQAAPYERALDTPVSSAPASDSMAFDATLQSTISLRQRLEDQIFLQTQNQVLRALGQFLVSQLDSAGYLQIDAEAICTKFAIDHDMLEAGVDLLQHCEPVGIGARSLKECLALQLHDRKLLDESMAIMIDHLELVATRDFAALQNLTGLSEIQLDQKLALIRELNPKPGDFHEGLEPESLIPDVFVTKNIQDVTDGEHYDWHVELNTDVLPRLLVNEVYYRSVSANANDREKQFLIECHQSASGLMKALDQRAKSILKVASEIVRLQDGFFLHGITHLKPMTLKQVADQIDMHESTVSRVTTSKYMSTPRGIFEMKFFFSSSIAGTSGETHSGEAVRHRIKHLIAQEPSTAILSDDAIVKKLRADGIDIARRTVAKYREALGLPSSVIRRREKKSPRHKDKQLAI
ncbi:MAG: RNA polymerase factor sigma-54, partial [Rhizobiales bacterium]|nr:RNA polymerase factor sigma-54 [Hyphomicrobiales bacterium]